MRPRRSCRPTHPRWQRICCKRGKYSPSESQWPMPGASLVKCDGAIIKCTSLIRRLNKLRLTRLTSALQFRSLLERIRSLPTAKRKTSHQRPVPQKSINSRRGLLRNLHNQPGHMHVAQRTGQSRRYACSRIANCVRFEIRSFRKIE